MGFGRGFGGKLPRGYQKSLEETFTTTASFNAYTASQAGGGGPGGSFPPKPLPNPIRS